MGDAAGNLEERIGRVEEEISGVEDEIISVEGEIRNCTDGDERKQLRAEKEQLRTEKEQLQTEKEQLQTEKELLQTEKELLHTEKEQLRTEKNGLLTLQLRNRDRLGTEREWLVQKIVELALPSMAPSHLSTSNKDCSFTPLQVEHWDVKDNIKAYLNEADNKRRAYDLSVTSSTERVQNFETFETDFISNIFTALVHFINKKNEKPLFALKKEGSLKKEDYDGMDVDDVAAKKGGFPVRADYLVTFGGKTCFPVKIKNGGLGPQEGESWKLHEVWAEYISKEGKGDYSEVFGIAQHHCVKVFRCICQLYEYMVLAKASDEPPLLLAALSYLVNTALGDDTAYSNRVVKGQFPTLPRGNLSKSSDESLDDISDPDYRRAGTNISGSGVRRSGRIGVDENQLALQDISAENLNFICSGILSCDGWSGFVFIGQMYGKPVALKFADVGTRRAEALVQEAKAYAKMEKLWGRVVPELVGHGLADSRSVYVATELLEGSELGDVAVTKEVEIAALEALDAVHACGLLHEDISSKNIMVVSEKKDSVRFPDFGFSCFKSNKKLQKAERIYLEQLLVHLMKQGRE